MSNKQLLTYGKISAREGEVFDPVEEPISSVSCLFCSLEVDDPRARGELIQVLGYINAFRSMGSCATHLVVCVRRAYSQHCLLQTFQVEGSGCHLLAPSHRPHRVK